MNMAAMPFENWEDLLPTDGAVGEEDPYAQLSPDQLADLAMLARMVRLLNEGKTDDGGSMARNADRLREAFASNDLDADWLLSQRDFVRQDRIRRSVNANVDGRSVRLLGVAVPLSCDEDCGTREFLLTATMGKCSHVPPPPYNQVSQVCSDQPIDISALTSKQGSADPWVWV